MHVAPEATVCLLSLSALCDSTAVSFPPLVPFMLYVAMRTGPSPGWVTKGIVASLLLQPLLPPGRQADRCSVERGGPSQELGSASEGEVGEAGAQSQSKPPLPPELASKSLHGSLEGSCVDLSCRRRTIARAAGEGQESAEKGVGGAKIDKSRAYLQDKSRD